MSTIISTAFGEELVCFRERRNLSSENAIVVQKALGDIECKKKKKKKVGRGYCGSHTRIP